ncbi:serine hydrolase domain-containing protein [Lacipirellula parvula]|uniref:Beta-lactamase n=1 Tax=Lacipirellula parvula TaxID=2650471 RepID=A0A5K7XK26_9BACT|nr:serine hydrolase domain-containing protein [Lacipirellula parvula]BBO34796.1 beta-lactamase [Lacipirellula parvula]
MILKTQLAEFLQKHPAPHAVAAVCGNGELLEVASKSDAEFGELADPAGTPFRIASMTKCFAAAAILKLRDAGRLQLDRSVAEYVPELRLDERWKRVTVRRLLRMRSGLPAADDPWADRKLGEPDAFLNAELFAGVQFSNDAGEEYQYSNLGYMLLGRVISNIAGVSALEYIERELLWPLGMEQTSWKYATGDNRTPRGAAGFRRAGEGFRAETEFHVESDLAVFGGLCSTSRDLARWVGFFTDAHEMHSARSSQFEQVLAASSRREMERLTAVMHPIDSVGRATNAMGYGYGLRGNFIGQEWFVGHSGGLPGFGSHMSWSQTRGIGVIALGNVTYFPANELCRELWLEIQADSPRAIAPLVHGEELVLRRGEALVAAVRSDAAALPAELFAYNVPLDMDLTELLAKLRKALLAVHTAAIEVRAERGLAGRIEVSGESVVFFSLAPAEGMRIQRVDFYGE